MNASSNSGEEGAPLPDLKFPTLEPVPAREVPDPSGAAIHVIELSELFLALAAGRPDFEARRLEMKTKVPFRFRDEEPSAAAGAP